MTLCFFFHDDDFWLILDIFIQRFKDIEKKIENIKSMNIRHIRDLHLHVALGILHYINITFLFDFDFFRVKVRKFLTFHKIEPI